MSHYDRPCGLQLIPRWALVALGALGACAGPVERSTRADLRQVERELAALPDPGDEPGAEPPSSEAPALDGSLDGYLTYAFAHSPSLRASFEQWRAVTHRPAQERRLPEPTITYAVFIRSIETHLGPQRHRLGAQQWFPWPSKLGAGGRAASLEAQAAQRHFEAHALEIAAEVGAAYWALWRVQRQREVLAQEVELLGGFSEHVRTRVELGSADLADLAQVDLSLLHVRDHLQGLDEREQVASAELVRAVGAPDGTATPVAADPPRVAEVDEPAASLTAEATEHPRVMTEATLSDAASERVREARADRLPSVGLGVDWIVVGPSSFTNPAEDDGRDAVSVSLSLKVPLWARAYKASEDEARAHGAAHRARAIAVRNAVAADVRQQLAHTHEDVRRVRAYRTTLVPQAETTLEAVLASYAAGRSSVAELLMAERALIDLQDELHEAEADYGTHLAHLERAVGRPVRTKGAADVDG